MSFHVFKSTGAVPINVAIRDVVSLWSLVVFSSMLHVFCFVCFSFLEIESGSKQSKLAFN